MAKSKINPIEATIKNELDKQVAAGERDEDKRNMEVEEEQQTIQEQATIEKLLKQRSKIQEGRTIIERQWLVNLAFLYGRQYFAIGLKRPSAALDERVYWELKNMERKKKTRRISNYILPLFRALLSKMLMMKSTITVDATTNTDRDKATASIGQEAAEEFWQNCNKNNPVLCQEFAGMQLILKTLFSYILSIGNGYLHPYFNPRTKTKAYLDERVIPEAEVGEVEMRVLHNFDLFWDPLKRYVISQRTMDVDEIEVEFGEKVPAENIEREDYSSRLINMMEGSYHVKYENAAKIYEKWELPNKKFPEGRHIACTKKQIIKNTVLPSEYKGRLPFVKFDYLDFMLGIVPYAQGMVEQLISLQEEYNFTITRLAGYKKWMAGKVMIPRKSKISSKWDDEVGQLIFYNTGFGVPTYQNPPAPPAYLGEELLRIRRDMEDVAGVHDTSLGRIPTGVKSGKAIENLSELDTSQLAPQLMTLEQKLSFTMEMVLEIMEEKYSEGRFIEITGDVYGQEVKSFKGSDLIGNRRIKISLGSSLPNTKQARQEFILEMEQRQLISKEKAKELLEFGDIEGIYHSMDETQAKEENNNITKENYQVTVEPYEDHSIHLKTHTDFMKTRDFSELPEEVKERFKQHIQEHQNYLLAEARAASGGQQPPTPAPPAARGAA